jgi:type II secretory pathway component PulF
VPRFRYRGTDEQGRLQQGELEAPGLVEASAELRAKGVFSLDLERADAPEAAAPLRDVDAFVFFNQGLAEMSRLGFPLPRAVREISGGMRRGRFRTSLERLEASLREGKSLHEAVAAQGSEFPPHYRFMLQAGTSSGNLPAVLTAVARNTEGVRRARRAVLDALAYPAVVLLFGAILVSVFLLLFVPLYQDLNRQYGFEPSVTTRAILGLFGSVKAQVALVGGALAAVLGGWAFMRRTIAGERLLLRLPLAGRVIGHLWMARFLGCLGVLLRGKAPLADALPVALGASGSLQLAAAAGALGRRAAEGAGVADVLGGAPVVPPEAVSYLALAERSGSVDRAAAELSELLTERAFAEGESLFVVLMPAALLLTGAVLAALFVSLVVPYIAFIERLAAP